MFYFPQALRWYVDTFGGWCIPEDEMNLRKGLKLLRQNSVQRHLLVQGLILTVITPPALSGILQQMGVSIDWFGVIFGVVFGVVSGV